jgi:polyisoprenoid-binding protein YceI
MSFAVKSAASCQASHDGRDGLPQPLVATENGSLPMFRTFTAALAAGLLLAGAVAAKPETQDPTKAPAGNYVLDKRHASLIVKVPHLGGFSHFTLRFDGLDGSYTLDPANWAATKAAITVDVKSIDTNVKGFNEELIGKLKGDKFPTMTFVSTQATGENGKGQISGDLTFLGKTRPTTFDVTYNGSGPGLFGMGARMGFSGVGHIKLSDYGFDVMGAGDDVDLLFEVEFEKK